MLGSVSVTGFIGGAYHRLAKRPTAICTKKCKTRPLATLAGAPRLKRRWWDLPETAVTETITML